MFSPHKEKLKWVIDPLLVEALFVDFFYCLRCKKFEKLRILELTFTNVINILNQIQLSA